MRFAFFGSSLISAYWNGACTYYRGIIKGLHALGHDITFFEPNAYDRQKHRDIPDPGYATVVVYEPADEAAVRATVARAEGFDVVAKTSGVGVFDEVLEAAVAELPGDPLRIFWDVDAPATLGRMERDPEDSFRRVLPAYDLVLTYGGGDPVVDRYKALGARECIPVYNALDPDTHHPVPPREELQTDLALLANRLPDREARVEDFFFGAVERLPDRHFLLGGNGWGDRVTRHRNVRYLGHVPPGEHNALNCSALAVLNVTREDMVLNGWSPATRVFEAAGAGACLVTDTWAGIEEFLEPGSEVLLARGGEDVADLLGGLEPEDARRIGDAARERMLAGHTYGHRARQLEAILAVHA
ncbi:MAG TPA: glycosyltransferase [Solirubrobacteraceae bacterium]|nr:glycosyltransferase [Solirubrobacteraceae bacterium]